MAKIDFSDRNTPIAAVPRSREEWLDWCWERNQRAMQEGWRNWLFIRDVAGKIHVEAAAGDDASSQDCEPFASVTCDPSRVRALEGGLPRVALAPAF